MNKHLRNFTTLCIAFLFAFCIFVSPSYAANIKGSHRVGGTNSHGKGSHYVVGHQGSDDHAMLTAFIGIAAIVVVGSVIIKSQKSVY